MYLYQRIFIDTYCFSFLSQVPIVFTILALVVLRTMPGALDAPPLTLDMSHYGANTIVYNTTTKADATTAIGRQYAKQVSCATHCHENSQYHAHHAFSVRHAAKSYYFFCVHNLVKNAETLTELQQLT